MEPKAFEEKLRSKLEELRRELARLRGVAEQKKQQEDELNVEMGITNHEIVESLERSLEEAEGEVDRLKDVTVEAWQERGDEIRSRIEDGVDELTGRFEALTESLKEQ